MKPTLTLVAADAPVASTCAAAVAARPALRAATAVTTAAARVQRPFMSTLRVQSPTEYETRFRSLIPGPARAVKDLDLRGDSGVGFRGSPSSVQGDRPCSARSPPPPSPPS